jgi:hypothetical protein
MTLTVSAYKAGAPREENRLPLRSALAGTESARATFYGSSWAAGLGLVLLPRLKQESELWVSGPDLFSLSAEAEMLAANLPATDEEYWQYRLQNIILAVQAATAVGGTVCIG